MLLYSGKLACVTADKSLFTLEIFQVYHKVYCDCFIALIAPTNISGIRGEPTVLEGNNLQLICEASSQVEPNITWTKEKTGNQGNTVVVQVGKVLTITNINRIDAGNYTCTAYNGFGKPENRTVYVDVTCECALKKTLTNGKK